MDECYNACYLTLKNIWNQVCPPFGCYIYSFIGIIAPDQCSPITLLQMTGSNEYKLNQGPEDSISAVKFSPSTAQFLLVSSWDSTVRLYDVVTNTIRMKYQHTAPVLDCAFYVSHRF